MKGLVGRIILGVFLALLVLLAVLLSVSFRVQASYDRGDAALWIQYGPLRLRLYPPKPAKETKKKRERKSAKEEKSKESQGETPKKKLSITMEQILYTLETLPPVLGRALGRVRRGIRVKPLRIHLLIAGDDPAGTVLLYGRAQAALATGMPAVRRAVHIREEDIRLFLDFQRTRPDCAADVGISIRGWTGARIALCAGGSLVKWFLGFRRLAPPPKAAEEEQQNAGAA